MEIFIKKKRIISLHYKILIKLCSFLLKKKRKENFILLQIPTLALLNFTFKRRMWLFFFCQQFYSLLQFLLVSFPFIYLFFSLSFYILFKFPLCHLRKNENKYKEIQFEKKKKKRKKKWLGKLSLMYLSLERPKHNNMVNLTIVAKFFT